MNKNLTQYQRESMRFFKELHKVIEVLIDREYCLRAALLIRSDLYKKEWLECELEKCLDLKARAVNIYNKTEQLLRNT
jgi:hypothetical protein